MKVVQTSELLGHFNIPNLELSKVAGYLKFNGKYPELRLCIDQIYYFSPEEKFGIVTCDQPRPASFINPFQQFENMGNGNDPDMVIFNCPVVILGKTISNIDEKFISEVRYKFDGLISWINNYKQFQIRDDEEILYQSRIEHGVKTYFTLEIVRSLSLNSEFLKQETQSEIRLIFDNPVSFHDAKKTSIEINTIVSIFRYNCSPILDFQLITSDKTVCHCWFKMQPERQPSNREELFLNNIIELDCNPFQRYYAASKKLQKAIRHCYYYFTKPWASHDDLSGITAEIEGFASAVFLPRKKDKSENELEDQFRAEIDLMFENRTIANKIDISGIKNNIIKPKQDLENFTLKKKLLRTYKYISSDDARLDSQTDLRFGCIDDAAELAKLVRHSDFHADVLDFKKKEHLRKINQYHLMLFLLGILNLAIMKYLGLDPSYQAKHRRLFRGIPDERPS